MSTLNEKLEYALNAFFEAKKLDPVGKEDDDVDNDGDSDSSDAYLKKRRAAVAADIAKQKKESVKESEEFSEGADMSVVAKFRDVDPSQRSYYVHQWAKENGIDDDEAMEKAGYTRGEYMGHGSYRWHYNPPK